MPKLTIIGRNTEAKEWDLPVGGSLMEVLREVGYDEVVAICGGNCSCATCHVYINYKDATAQIKPSEDEEVLIESLNYSKQNSRLACQVEVNSLLEGSVVCISPEE